MLKIILSFLISLITVLILMPHFIDYMKKLSVRQSISEYSLEEDQKKAGTPIMGGILFILVPIVVTLIVYPGAVKDINTWIVILAFVGYGFIGFMDDYLIAVKKNNEGLKPSYKFAMQIVLGAVFFLIYRNQAHLEISVPFTNIVWNLGFGYFILVLLMFAGGSNAVNLTDGMDGLSAGCTVIALVPFFVVARNQGRVGLMILISSLMGALFGYLYYNKKPARVFMGDTGALALGGIMAAMAMVMKIELAFIVIAGVFVIDTLTVILQVASVKIRHKRIFTYTPIHFAFRIKGMPEENVVRMFWAVEAVFALLGLFIALH